MLKHTVRPGISLLIGTLASLLLSALPGTLIAEDDLMDMSLDELMNLEVTSVSRRPQSLSSAPAAVFVITQSDIRRSGANTIPDVLRMAPGVNVAQIDGNKWAVTARGFNGRFAGKLLVLMDGRTIYSPLFSGVFWDNHDIDLESIDRIEVIRGPGATLWGANAVNGVINIITKHSADTRGGHARAGFSNGGGEAVLRYGGRLSDDWGYRVYGKYADLDGNRSTLGFDTADNWQSARLGLRLDRGAPGEDQLTIISEVQDGEMGATVFGRSLTPPYQSVLNNGAEESTSAFVLMAWNRSLDNGSNIALQGYVNHTKREGLLFEALQVDTFDLDFQHDLRLNEHHELVWGLGFRHTSDEMRNGFGQGLTPADDTQTWISGFIQDEIALPMDGVFLTIGTKLEDNTLSQEGLEVEPNLRLRWNMGENGTGWASVSRAVRLPSRGDVAGQAAVAIVPPLVPENPSPVPLLISINGNPEIAPEELLAYELGYRVQPTDQFTLDVALFLHDHDKGRSVAPSLPLCQPAGTSPLLDPLCVLSADYIEQPFIVVSSAREESYGIEIVADWWPRTWWRLQTTYSSLRFDRPDVPLNAFEALSLQPSPENEASVRSMMNIGEKTELDVWVRYVGELDGMIVDSYTTMDLRLGWSPIPGLQLSLVGRNLLEEYHAEFVSEIREVVPVEIERRAYLEARWSF